jgi:hypothetical protein
MNFTEALDVLRKGNGLDPTENEAVEVVRSEIAEGDGIDLQVTLTTLGNELVNSKNPSFSHQILQAILASGNEKIEEDIILQGLFIKKTLGSESVLDGVFKCMIALGSCTKVFGD